MTIESAVAGSSGDRRDLSYWMARVLKELDNLRTSPAPDAVHDLRVALRRCRSLAAVMEEVDPNRAWPEMRSLGRKLFRQLGELRDTQVLEEWVEKLGSAGDPVREVLLAHLKKTEEEETDAGLRAAAKFDGKAWKSHERTLRKRVRVVPPNRLAAEGLALERLLAAKELHLHALRTEAPEPWHALRIGVKRFRYTVEGLLPELYEKWGDTLKHVQDLLGEVHDLDVLQDTIVHVAAEQPEAIRESWRQRIAAERTARLEEYRQMCMGERRLWQEWREGLPDGKRMEAAAQARLQATARAMGAAHQKPSQIARLAVRLFDGLRRERAGAPFESESSRKILRAAARLHAVGAGLHAKPPQRAARKFLRTLPLPVGWSEDEWDLLGLVVRYHRGEEPKTKHRAYARLSHEEQVALRAMAGVLRLARVLRRFGVSSAKALELESSVDALIIRAPGLEDTEASAAKVAAGKHLLETLLDQPLLVKPLPASPKIVELPRVVQPGQQSIASD